MAKKFDKCSISFFGRITTLRYCVTGKWEKNNVELEAQK